jgi:hypothetical protein
MMPVQSRCDVHHASVQPLPTATPRPRRRRLLYAGAFAPAALLLLAAALSTLCEASWQGVAGPHRRARLARGSLTYCWATTATWRLTATGPWTLGTDYAVNGRRVTQHAQWTGWPPQAQEIVAPVVITAGDVHIPIVYLAIAAALPPLAVVAHQRVRRRPPYACRRCGYDLRGLASAPCPECGGVPCGVCVDRRPGHSRR